jgi:4-hydroxybenzoate polyprenyltransferase
MKYLKQTLPKINESFELFFTSRHKNLRSYSELLHTAECVLIVFRFLVFIIIVFDHLHFPQKIIKFHFHLCFFFSAIFSATWIVVLNDRHL